MKITHLSRLNKLLVFLLGCGAVLAFPAAARATNVTVDCSGQTLGAFTSLQAAIDSLDVVGPHSISVTGNCNENLRIFNRERILISAPSGQNATITAANPTAIVIHIFGSRSITLVGLTIQGGSTGVLVNTDSQVNIQNSTVQNNSGNGVGVQIGSVLVMDTSSTIQNNGGNGLSDGGGSSVTLSTLPGQRISILGNAGDGIDIDGSFLQVNFGALDVENNAGAAIFQSGGRLLAFGGGGENVFQNNGEGVDVFNAGSANFFGKNTFRNNGEVALQILSSAVQFTGRILPNGAFNATLIEGHSTVGVNVVRLGELTMNGPHKIQNNGNATADPTLRGGIRLIRSSLTLGGGVAISNNTGPGIRADQNTSLGLTGITVSNNSEEGVRVRRQSVAGFTPPLTITGNGAASISCDTTSLAFGDLTGVTNLDCSRIEREVGPPRAGTVQD